MCLELVGTRRDHGSKTYRSDEDVAQENTDGPTVHEGGCCSEEETCTNYTTDTGSERQPWDGTELGEVPDHGDMAVL